MSTISFPVTTPALIDLAIKSAGILLLVGMAAAAARRRSSAAKHLVWTLGILSLLLLPVVSTLLPAWHVAWIPDWTLEQPVARPAEIPAAAALPIITPPNEVIVESPRDIPSPVVMEPVSQESPPATRPALSVLSEIDWIPVAWGAGMLLVLCPLAVGLWRVRRLQRASRIVEDPDWLALLEVARQQVGVRQRVQLRSSDAVRSPLTWGVIRPVVLVPLEARHWPVARLKCAFLHELAHIRRRDWLTQILAHLACAIYWFNPLVWVAARRMRAEREQACDDEVLMAGVRATDYAQELVSLAAVISQVRQPLLAAVPMARSSAIEGRVRSILDMGRRRAALTTIALVLGLITAGAVLAPLAMLRAAQVNQPAAQPPRDAAAPPISGPNVWVNAIRLSVIDEDGGKVPSFRVLAGVPTGVGVEYEKRTGRLVFAWQPHTCVAGADGEYLWPLTKGYEKMAFRIEADGYQPMVIPGIKKSDGPIHLTAVLEKDLGLAGRVLTPDGQPAAGAVVGLAIPSQELDWREGKLRGYGDPVPQRLSDRARPPRFFTADAQGYFQLPTESEPAAVLIIHDSGVREVDYHDWRKSPLVTLQNWGSISGNVHWGDQVGVNEEVTLSITRDDYGYPGMVSSYRVAQTDEAGRFSFDRVLPGHVQISRPVQVPDAVDRSGYIFNGMFQHLTVASGEPTRTVLGGKGRKVTGKLEGWESYEGATVSLTLEGPSLSLMTSDGMALQGKAYSQFRTQLGKWFFHADQPVQQDGSFDIENVLPGRYLVSCLQPDGQRRNFSSRVEVPAESPDEAPQPFDLGKLQKVAQLDPVQPPAAAPAAPAPAKAVTIRGKLVDDVTGEPLSVVFIVQAGKFEPAQPEKVTWGFSETRNSRASGTFDAQVRWSEGWTARILADGYMPQPVISKAPPAGADVVEVTLRMKRGISVRGTVLDHTGEPLKDAGVFAIGPTSLNLYGGDARGRFEGDEIDNSARPVRTDAQGRFELAAGGAQRVAISHPAFDLWAVPIPNEGELTIRLPKPVRVDIEMDVEGADAESVIFYQFLNEGVPDFKGVESIREFKVSNPGKLSLAALPPGKYQFTRNVMHRLGDMGRSAMLDRQFIEVRAGEVKPLSFARKTGARIRGRVIQPPNSQLSGVIVSVREVPQENGGPLGTRASPRTFSSQTIAADGTFLTERIPPGMYELVAEGYTPEKPDQMRISGWRGPSHINQVRIEVPASGEVAAPEISLDFEKK